ncbi:SEPP1 protein, partial [Atractosteus spatula]|nr:SEPP1 protein [Atractosteus spatula]
MIFNGLRSYIVINYSLICLNRLDALRLRLEQQGLVNISYVVVNHQGEQSHRLYPVLRKKMSQKIRVYDQDPLQEDVWKILSGEKDDFLIYDRCGSLTHHLGLPYSMLTMSYVEDAIRDTYCKGICGNCSLESSSLPATCNSTVKPEGKPEDKPEEAPESHGHPHAHGHGHHHSEEGRQSHRRHSSHGHHHGHGRHHHGAQQEFNNGQTQRHSQTHQQQQLIKNPSLLSQQEVVDFPLRMEWP